MSENTTPIEPHKTLELDTSQPSEALPAQSEERQLTPKEALMEAQIEARMQKLRARDEIIAKRQQEFAKEVTYGEKMQDEARISAGLAPLPHETDEIVDLGAGEAQPDAVAAPEPQRAESPVPAPQQQTAPAVPAPAAPQLITVDVGQQRISVTPAQLMELARRGLVATHQATQQQPQYVQNQAPLYAQNQQPVGNEQRPLLSDDEAKAFHRRIAYGDSETDGAQAIRELAQTVLQRAPTPQFNPQQIAANASAQTLAQIRHEQELTALGTEYPDVFENTTRARLAALEYHNLMQEDAALGVRRSSMDAYRESANRVRSALGGQPAIQSGQPASNQTAPQAAPAMDQSRTERKRAAPRVPTGVSRVIPADQGPRHPTGSELVDRLRVARHQTPLH